MTGLHDASSPAATLFLSSIDKVEAILDEERIALKALSGEALRRLSDQKARSLLEIRRAAGALTEADRPTIAARIVGLRAKLEASRAGLQLHLDAARSISDLVSRAVDEAESDGTYSARGRPL